MTVLLPWFPILLSVAIGGRLLGRNRGFALGLLCALFWLALVSVPGGSAGPGVWSDPWTVATLIAGATAILTIGGWAGETSSGVGNEPYESGKSASEIDGVEVSSRGSARPCDSTSLAGFSRVMDQFADWLADHCDDSDPWGQFDDLLRTALYQCCKATHVRPYRLLSEGEELSPLSEPDPFVEVRRLDARKGIVGHVLTTGRPFVAGDRSQGELVSRLAAESPDPPAWCFAIRRGTSRLGVVTVGQLEVSPEDNGELLRATERLVTHFWCRLSDVRRSRVAAMGDPVSGVFTREAFLRMAQQSLRESYDQGEPVAVGVIALEGLRALNDSGRWEVADEVVREVSGELRRKVRVDDRVGRFDGSRFVLLLRRVDSELASLIVSQLLSRLDKVCGDEQRWRGRLEVRCGVVGSGVEQPDLRSLISRAVAQCRHARIENTQTAYDLGPITALGVGDAT